jgi:hypothetical protein
MVHVNAASPALNAAFRASSYAEGAPHAYAGAYVHFTRGWKAASEGRDNLEQWGATGAGWCSFHDANEG